MKPCSIVLRVYHVGFGDCFLLTFGYPDSERHVLIDYGTTATPGDKGGDVMRRVAEDIQVRTGGKLVAVVATHRHRDHISGFGTAAGEIISGCNPELVVQPWTEDPALESDATAALDRIGAKGFVAALANMHLVSQSVLNETLHLRGQVNTAALRQLSFLGENNLSNRRAVDALMNMAPNQYVYHGCQCRLAELLPGVEVAVLGPPTVEQTSALRKQRPRDQEEYWHFWSNQARPMRLSKSDSAAFDAGLVFPYAPRYAPSENPPQARWFRRRAEEMRASELLSIVRTLDRALNNTSVILLFSTGGKKLLFPGDAQIENWSYALEQPGIGDLLADVTFYKVGHHGSLNATPKSLLKLIRTPREQFRTVNSTMPGKHGDESTGTEVPRRKLVDTLRARSIYFSTDEMDEECAVLSHDFVL
jgi:hypothetical protein